MKTSSNAIKELTIIPGIGKSIASYLRKKQASLQPNLETK